MHVTGATAVAAAVLAFAVVGAEHGAAGHRGNPDGYGIYSPLDPSQGTYRYDPRSWYYDQPSYYPYYGSSYWVPRAHMRYRYRYRYLYYGPKYRYHPAWGYPREGYNAGWQHWGW